METFSYAEEDFLFGVVPSNTKTSFDELLLSKWNSKMDKGNIFLYKLNISLERNISDKYFLQYIPDRASSKRPSAAVHSVTEPFDPTKFHFNKIKDEEKLFALVNRNCSSEDAHENLIAVNVSPLGPCSVLLVPTPDECLPQMLTETSLNIAIEFSLLSSNRFFRVGFNGLAAFASVNHLHFHGYLLEREMFLESATVEELAHPCYQLLDYPAKGFVFQIKSKEEVSFVTTSIFKLVRLLLTKNIPHNLFISRGLDFESAKIAKVTDNRNCLRIYVWARKPTFGAKDLTDFNIALCELFGHMIIKNEKDYHTFTEEYIDTALRELTDEPFNSVICEAKKLF